MLIGTIELLVDAFNCFLNGELNLKVNKYSSWRKLEPKLVKKFLMIIWKKDVSMLSGLHKGKENKLKDGCWLQVHSL